MSRPLDFSEVSDLKSPRARRRRRPHGCPLFPQNDIPEENSADRVQGQRDRRHRDVAVTAKARARASQGERQEGPAGGGAWGRPASPAGVWTDCAPSPLSVPVRGQRQSLMSRDGAQRQQISTSAHRKGKQGGKEAAKGLECGSHVLGTGTLLVCDLPKRARSSKRPLQRSSFRSL